MRCEITKLRFRAFVSVAAAISFSLATFLPIKHAVAQQVTGHFSLLGPAWAHANESQQKSETKVIVFIGDSLTDGYGVKKEEAYPQLIAESLKARGQSVKVINGGISGSVTAEADRRVKFYLKTKPDVVVIALGANDALKGTPVDVMKKNLAKAIDVAQASGAKVLLCGMRIFTNFGAEYAKNFERMYTELAREKKVEIVPFLLEGVALNKELNISDGKHPNAKGHAIMAETVLKRLEKLL